MKPSTLILDLLRTYHHTGTSVKTIMATGNLFGFTENLMRVSLSRLVARHTVENIKRGYYRLAVAADPLNDFVEQWRLGDKRSRRWHKGEWVCIHTPQSLSEKGIWALFNNGFRQGADELWIRPDNLRVTGIELTQSLRELGLPESAILMSSASIDVSLQERWLGHFNIEALNRHYQETTRQLVESMQRLQSMPVELAKKESFNLGGYAIQVLVKDPLIPECLQQPGHRHQLWQTMLKYDRAGRDVWANRSSDSSSVTLDDIPDIIPTPNLAIQL
ncbi:MAG: hypothetical protein ABGY96_18980 [bacterium]|nr:hypothetical protein [Gammaproteobacteria bacterium]HIL97951.1 hypothetical protein [Pseudomonadales bacterium]